MEAKKQHRSEALGKSTCVWRGRITGRGPGIAQGTWRTGEAPPAGALLGCQRVEASDLTLNAAAFESTTEIQGPRIKSTYIDHESLLKTMCRGDMSLEPAERGGE